MTTPAITYRYALRVSPWKRIRPAITADRTMVCARITGAKATGAEARNPRPPARSGWVGVKRRSRRETRQRNRNHTKRRKYQR